MGYKGNVYYAENNDTPTTYNAGFIENANILNEIEVSVLPHNPLNYGATGDGVTDDTTAVQACITANNYVPY